MIEIIGLISAVIGIIWFFVQRYLSNSAQEKKRRENQAKDSMLKDEEAMAKSILDAERRKKDREIEDSLLKGD